MANRLENIAPYFTDLQGKHLQGGYIYIGVDGLNPETNPISVFWDSYGTIPAAQPIRTINGHPDRNGAIGNLYTNELNYSITVKDKHKKLVSTVNKKGGSSGTRSFETRVEVATTSVVPKGLLSFSVRGTNVIGDGGSCEFLEYGSATGNPVGTIPGTVEPWMVHVNNGNGYVYICQPYPGTGLTPKHVSAVGGGADDTTPLADWARAPASLYPVKRVNAEYLTTVPIVMNQDCELIISSAGHLAEHPSGFTGNQTLMIEGTLTAIPALSVDAAKGAFDLTFSSAPSVSENDVITFYNPTDYSLNQYRSYYRDGDRSRVRSVSGTSVSLVRSLRRAVTAAGFDLYRQDSPVISVTGSGRISAGAGRQAVRLRRLNNAYFKGPRCKTATGAAILPDQCFECEIHGIARATDAPAGNNYGMAPANCTDCTFYGTLHSQRHGSSTGGGDEAGATPSAGNVYNILRARGGPATAVLDCHGNCHNETFIAPDVDGSITVGGEDITVIGGRFGQDSQGINIYLTEVGGGTFRFIGTHFTGQLNPQTFGRASLWHGGTLAGKMTRALRLQFDNVIWECPNAAGPLMQIDQTFYTATGASKAVDIVIDGINLINMPGITALAGVRSLGTDFPIANASVMAVHRQTGLPANAYYMTHSSINGVGSGTRHIYPTQTGSAVLAITTGTNNKIAAPVNFRNKYPFTPDAGIAQTPNLWAGTQAPIPGLYSISYQDIRPMVAAPNAAINFGATVNQTITWVVGLDRVL